jgi:predicted dienelactone hydrolase
MRRSLVRSLALLALFAFASAAEAGRPRYADPNDYGPFGVGHTLVHFVDAARGDRTLRTEIWYPVDPEDAVGEPAFYDFQFFGLGLTSPIAIEEAEITSTGWLPMVIFSHGSCGPSWQSTPLVEALASHGMIVVAPNHAGNSVNDCLGTGNPDPFEEVARNRPLDVSFLIDAMLARVADPDDFFYVRVDPRRIGVAGHSFGGYTALAMAAGLDRPDLGIQLAPDPRVRAIAPIAPASGLFSDAELASIEVPMLLLSATEDTTTPVVTNTTRPWDLAGSRPLYRADVDGAGHLHFANLCDIAQALLDFGVHEAGVAQLLGAEDYYATCGSGAFPIAEARRIQSFYVTAFFKRHLWWDGRYDPFLAPDWALAHEPDVLYSTKEDDE